MAHLLGTDSLGRDLLTRILVGARVSLLVGIFSVVVAGVIGTSLGLVAGYYGSWIDSVIMRVADAFHAIPRILLAMVVLFVLGPSVLTLIMVIGVTNWVSYARLIRGEVLTLKEKAQPSHRSRRRRHLDASYSSKCICAVHCGIHHLCGKLHYY